MAELALGAQLNSTEEGKGLTQSLPVLKTNQGIPAAQIRKSTSMLQDLQEYIKGVEAIANARKDELEKLYEERREEERREKLRRANFKHAESASGNFMQMADIPKKVQSLHEDIKAQKDKARKYKEKANDSERSVLVQQQQLNKLEDKLKVVSEALSAVGKRPGQVFDEKEMLDTLTEKERQLEELQNRLQVVIRSREVDLKKFRLEKKSDKREYEKLLDEFAAAKIENEEKGKNIRTDALTIKNLLKEKADIKRQLTKPAPTSHDFAHGVPNNKDESDAWPRVVYDERHLQLMICVVRDDGNRSGKAVPTDEEDPVKIQIADGLDPEGHPDVSERELAPPTAEAEADETVQTTAPEATPPVESESNADPDSAPLPQ
uniref:Lebercilin domain-containing protein n=1 Tax=Pyramimonas obovata TaxID=1411642 RepID=A0A7S0WH37_9CHLO|mmetsp:Transcript_2543/g.5295  ORF Transcript_2543/g.5295 Transcript_2543/m.5295 type:complete len:377 (+) Transcript_2543:245-1375(+)|eukprot:CAMPEP_0118931376 /NCGR_PEP_ID=MMETSP1169-20130426/7740_1 /TAXON_ID=36882 /ORGANISM="Pyramimonas obovata, Strain CCMP722" /LENGTH=376 /DNA_ID=CAMNT_0006873871 /DNA_START=244 /DNA_END=1374 /DNA_ORIENTATION=-